MNIIYGNNGIAAMTFADVPWASPASYASELPNDNRGIAMEFVIRPRIRIGEMVDGRPG